MVSVISQAGDRTGSSAGSLRSGQAMIATWYWLGPIVFVSVIGLYFFARYGGLWADSDSAALTSAIHGVINEGRLVTRNSSPYPNGFAYQALSAFIVSFTGLDVATLQQIVYPFLVVLVVLPAWLLYRELTGSARGAALAVILLFAQPEFLFVVLRSSHEKFTRLLMLMCLFWFVRSFRLSGKRGFAVHVILFYFTTFAFVSSNNLLGQSFILAIVLALGIGWSITKISSSRLWGKRRQGKSAVSDVESIADLQTLRNQMSNTLRRLLYTALISLGIAYIFTFYAYTPATHDVQVLGNIWDRVAALFLDVQVTPTNAYATVVSGWINLPVYFLVSAGDWIIIGVSFVLWARQGISWLRGKSPPDGRIAWLLWILYAAFGLQGAMSVVADASGVLGSNLQLRIFPSFSIIAVALVSRTLVGTAGPKSIAAKELGVGKRSFRIRVPKQALNAALAVALAVLAVLAVLKATNEPALSNKWTFYKPGEMDALLWSNAHMQSAALWTEFDERLTAAYGLTQGGPTNGNSFYGSASAGGGTILPTDLLISDITILRSERLAIPLPLPQDALRVYDNGDAQVYHRRPLTPYQH